MWNAARVEIHFSPPTVHMFKRRKILYEIGQDYFHYFSTVCTTNQDGLNDHFQGKKHKHKEAAFREQKDNKSSNIVLSPKKSKFIQLVDRPCDDLISEKKSKEGSSGTNDNDSPSLLIDDSANDLRNNTAHEKLNK